MRTLDAEQTSGHHPSVSHPPTTRRQTSSTTAAASNTFARSRKEPLERFGAGVAHLVVDELVPLISAFVERFTGAASEMSSELKVSEVADVINDAYDALRGALMDRVCKHAGLCAAVGEEAMGELKLASKIATAAHARVECSVVWTAPAASKEMAEAAKVMAAAQSKAVRLLKDGHQADEPLDKLFEVVKREQMPLCASSPSHTQLPPFLLVFSVARCAVPALIPGITQSHCACRLCPFSLCARRQATRRRAV
jgi:hypothetical protein